MSSQLLLVCSMSFLLKSASTYRPCLQESTPVNYLFLNTTTQLQIPLLPLDCILCQSAYQVDIQLADEQYIDNRTIQRIKILLRNFEIEDLSYICLVEICPISVEHGSDSIFVNVTSPLFAHAILSLLYLNDDIRSIRCAIQTRFALLAFPSALTCTEKLYLHPRRQSQISGQLIIRDCRADVFEPSVYRTRVQFQHGASATSNRMITMQPTGRTCEYILESTSYLSNASSIRTEELVTTVTMFPFPNPWKQDTQTLGPCRTKLIPYQEMAYTSDAAHTRNIHVELGQTIQLRCPIDGSDEYLQYTWYYQRYQPRYQLSHNRTIVLSNITDQMQGKYMCTGDDENEVLEFETTVHILTHSSTKFSFFRLAIIIIFTLPIASFCLIVIIVICYSTKRSPSMTSPVAKQKSLTIHHDVVLTIEHTSGQQTVDPLWNQVSYHAFDYIDEQPTYSVPSTDISSNQLTHVSPWSWIKESSADLRQEHIAHRLSTRHRNVNGQPPAQLAIPMSSHSDITLSPAAQSNPISDSLSDHINEMEILKISVPFLTQYPVVRSASSVISFDSQSELDQFNQMTSVCVDNEAPLVR